ncbi:MULTISPECIES: classical arabinogalactan protein 4 [Stenotrophomonas]|uniref:classical arabinogalactan protein 4 n=1 Tax=Stenotrophomonas TaxID=40323 RepID=UPI0013551F29|nr:MULTISPECIES: classical arabinogalactan protein 4 [Stenotrophomonas]MCH1909620.1 classical arabinogalactan protein 4 [Stenotrophomonas sp. Y6]MTI73574.1 classical arabinogalactan protein 4 [Stenotrophomonas sp.]
MKRIALLLTTLLAATPALAQLKPTPAPTETRPVSLPPPSKPASDASGQAADNARLRERLEDSAGKAAPARPRPAAKPQTAQVPVYDQEGRRLNGMRPAGPGRVMDTRTGRYHDTVPSGDGVRIVR